MPAVVGELKPERCMGIYYRFPIPYTRQVHHIDPSANILTIVIVAVALPHFVKSDEGDICITASVIGLTQGTHCVSFHIVAICDMEQLCTDHKCPDWVHKA